MKSKTVKVGAEHIVLMSKSDHEDLLDRLTDLEVLNKYLNGEYDDSATITLDEYKAKHAKKYAAAERAATS